MDILPIEKNVVDSMRVVEMNMRELARQQRNILSRLRKIDYRILIGMVDEEYEELVSEYEGRLVISRKIDEGSNSVSVQVDAIDYIDESVDDFLGDDDNLSVEIVDSRAVDGFTKFSDESVQLMHSDLSYDD